MLRRDYLCRYLPIKYNCLAATTFPLSTHRVVIEWLSHVHQPISFSYVIGLCANSTLLTQYKTSYFCCWNAKSNCWNYTE